MSASTRRPFAASRLTRSDDGQFAIVLTDDEDDGTTMMSTESSDDESTIFRRPEASSSSSVVTCQRVLSDDVTRPSAKVFAPSLNGRSKQATSAGEPKLLPFDGESDDDDASTRRCRCPADAVNTAAVLAVVLLSYAAFPLHVPDIAVPPQTTTFQVRPRTDVTLEAVVIGALVGSVLLAPSVDVRGARRNVGRTLFTGSSCVVLFAFLRCIPGVPVPILCLCAVVAGAGLVTVQLAALHILTGNDSGGDISSLSWYSLPSVVQRNFVVSGLVTAAVLGGPSLSAILRLMLTAPKTDDLVSSSVESRAASADWSSSDATTAAAAFSNFSRQQHSLMVEFSSLTNVTDSIVAAVGSTDSHMVWTTVSRPEVVLTSHHLAFVLCLLLCSLGALPISMFAVDDRSDVGVKAKRKNYDDVDDGQSLSLKAIARRLIRAYGHREVILIAVTSTFFGLLRMFNYFAFVRYYAPVEPPSILLAIVLMTFLSATVAVAVGFALLHVGRIKLLLPVAIALLPLLVTLLVDKTWTRDPAFYYSMAGSLAVIDGCMSVVCTAFLTLVPSLIEWRSVHGLSTACHSIGQLTAFAIYANIDAAVPYNDFAAGGSSWTPGRIITAFVMTSLVIATLCYLAAEISYRLAVADRASPGLIGPHPPVPVPASVARIRHQGRVTWASSSSDGVLPVDDPSTRKFPYRYMAVARPSKDRSDREGDGSASGSSNGNHAFHKLNSDAVKLQWMNGSRQLGDGGEQVDEKRPADDESLSAQSQRQQLLHQFDDEHVTAFDETEAHELIDLER